MNKKTELVYAIKALFDACNPHDIDPEEIPQRLETMNNLKELDFEDLLQALRFNAETVYAYSAEGCDCGTGCTYYGQELFPRRATRIYSFCVMEEIWTALFSLVARSQLRSKSWQLPWEKRPSTPTTPARAGGARSRTV